MHESMILDNDICCSREDGIKMSESELSEMSNFESTLWTISYIIYTLALEW